jgi:TonB family protein
MIKGLRLTPATLKDGSRAGIWVRVPISFGSNVYFPETRSQSEPILEMAPNGQPPPGVVPPQAVNSHRILRVEQYGMISARRQEQGQVSLRFEILPDGTVGTVEVTQSSKHPYLDYAAAAFVKGWLYRPATQGGKPIRVRQTAIVTFQLR